MARVAFFTIAVLHGSWNSPRSQGFVARAAPIYAHLESCEGYIGHSDWDEAAGQWRWGEWVDPSIFQGEAYFERVPKTLTLWQDLESVFAFAYNGVHAEALSHRKEWFAHPQWPSYVAWWVDNEHTPNYREACQRFEKLHRVGSTPEAFDFKQPFSAGGQPIQIDREAVKKKVKP